MCIALKLSIIMLLLSIFAEMKLELILLSVVLILICIVVILTIAIIMKHIFIHMILQEDDENEAKNMHNINDAKSSVNNDNYGNDAENEA